MLKKLRKILPVLLVAALALAALAGCAGNYTSAALAGDRSGDVTSNGGFVVQKGNYVYFINGSADASDDNTYGDVVQGSLQRISASDLAAGNYTGTETVVPLLLVSSDYTSGVYIYGDTVYYATPNVIENMQGEVDTSYLDFKSSSLDGSETMRDYYVQVSDSSTVYRYVQEPESGDVYLIYVDSANTEIHSYNTRTGENTVLVSGYSSYILPEEIPNGEQDYTVYYTMSVTRPNTYTASSTSGTTESYQQFYAVSAFETECPYTVTEGDGEVPFTESQEYLDAYTDKDADEDDEDRVMEYINLGTLVLDGVGSGQSKTPFNHDWTGEESGAASLSGYTYSFISYTDGSLYLSVSKVTEGTSFVYRFDEAAYAAAVTAGTWNSITANPTILANGSGNADDTTTATDAITPVAISSSNATSSALYYVQEGVTYYIYVDSNGNIFRNAVNAATDTDGTFTYADLIDTNKSATLARAQTEAALLYRSGDYLYYSMTGTNGNALYRINYTGDADDYNNLEGEAATNDDYKATQYLQLDYNSSWYEPEVITVGGTEYLFFNSAGDYAGGYAYVMQNPADNKALTTLNERWEDVQAVITDLSDSFSNASQAAQYYFYSADADLLTLLTDEEDENAYYENYTEEDLDLIGAFMDPTSESSQSTLSSYRLDFTALYDDSGDETVLYNTESAFYGRIGQIDEDDEESLSDSLKGAYLQATESTDTSSDAWTWQWAAIFVPVGVVVIAAVVVAVVLVRRRR